MKLALKSVAYLVLLLLAVYFARQMKVEYEASTTLASVLPTERGETNVLAGAAAGASTNSDTTLTNTVSAKPSEGEPGQPAPSPTNALTTASAAGSTNQTATTSAKGDVSQDAGLTHSQQVGKLRSAAFKHLGLFIVTLILLGGLAAWDFARSVSEKSHELIFQENEGAERAPEYEAAEQEWSNGNYLEAIRQMREYLKHHSSEQYVALRIAEIYEKDLGNHVAAAMELEEVLGKRLPREKWGWTAIHLANIYSGKLNKPDQALALLTRIVEHYPETGAAKKARARLGLPDPEVAGIATTESTEVESTPVSEDPSDPSNLPKGFRPKK